MDVVEIEPTDSDSFIAIAMAQTWRDNNPKQVWILAEVDRYDGLVLTDKAGQKVHFKSAIRGYTGAGPQATAKILIIFGFRHQDEFETLLAELSLWPTQSFRPEA